jgi:orotidine-5'-phosphate decarboxylase
VPTVEEALASVERLDNISFLQGRPATVLTGGLPDLLHALRTKRVFVDLKLPGDISNTIAAVIDACVEHERGAAHVERVDGRCRPSRAARAARAARNSSHPKFLTVPVLSSLDASDLPAGAGGENGVEAVIVSGRRPRSTRGATASSRRVTRSRSAAARFQSTLIVSPGIRPAGASTTTTSGTTTPAEGHQARGRLSRHRPPDSEGAGPASRGTANHRGDRSGASATSENDGQGRLAPIVRPVRRAGGRPAR